MSRESPKLFLITDHGGHRLGQIDIYEAFHSCDGWELGHWIYRPEDLGNGYTTEAVRLVTAYLFGQEPIDRVQILVDPRNAGSGTVAERAGCLPEGTPRHAWFDRGEHHALQLFSILRSDAAPLSGLLAPLDE